MRVSWRGSAPLIAIAVSTVILVVLVRELDPREMLRVLAQSQWGWVAAAAIINLLNSAVETLRWRVPLSSVKPGTRFGSAFRALIAGTLGNVVLPLKLGDGVRAYVLAESEGLPFASTVSTIVLDRMIDLAAFLVVVMLTVAVYPLPEGVLRVTRYAFIGLVVCFGAVFAMAIARRHRKSAEPPAGGSRLVEQFEHFTKGLSALGSGRLLVPFCAMALLSWATRLMVIWTAFKAFHLALPLADAAVVLVIVNVSIAVVGTPGNVGPFELAMVGALKLLSVPQEVALSYAVALHIAEVLPPVLIGLVLIWRGHLDLGRAKRAATAQGGSGQCAAAESQEQASLHPGSSGSGK